MGIIDVYLSASVKVSRIPKDGKDGTSVTILSTKVLYQVSASPTDIPTSWFEKIEDATSRQTDSKPYLWSKTIVYYSVGEPTVTFGVSYKGKDGTNGTSFTPKGTATAFYNNMSSVPAYEDGMDYDVYIVNVDDRSNPTSELPPYVCRYEYESFVVEHAEFGDGYNVNGHLYVANSNEWVDFGEIQGAKGDPGDPGKDAINIVFSPAELVFDADDNGNLIQAEKSAEIKVFRGNKQLTYLTDWNFPSVGKQTGDNCKASFMVEENSSPLKPIAKIYDISSTKIVDSDPQAQVPASSGGINVPIKIGDVTYNAYLSFSVNVNTFAKVLIEDNKQFIRQYTEISNQYNSVSSELASQGEKQKELTEKVSTIEQKADNIKLEVLSKTSGRRNMLVNSAFRNQDSVFIHSLARIEKNTGVDGVNCIHSSDKYSGTDDGNYIGAFWDSTQRNGVVTNIPIVKGKKYVISCWIRSDNLDLPFVIECFFMNSINQQNRGEDAVRKEYHVDNVNEWKRIDFVVDTTDTSSYASKVTPYLAVNFWSNTKNVPKVTDANGEPEYPTCHAYICKPMMEEGDTYSGWTLSEADYDYVGGNMIDNARNLEVGGNLESINASNVADYGLAYYGDSMSLRINNTNADSTPSIMTFTPSLEVGVDYMFSFLAKGTANIGLYALCDSSVDGDYLLSEDSVNADVREIDTLNSRYAPIVLIPTQLTTEYKRYWGHMRFYGHVPSKLYLQLNNAGDVYICQPKLEIGATMTEFTERKTDLVDKASLKKAGIEITTNQVKLYGDKVRVLTRKDETTEYEEAGMFSNGKLNANLIDAINIVTQALQTGKINADKATIRNLSIIGSLRNPFTRVSESTDVDFNDNIAVITKNYLWEKNEYSLPWDNTQNGRRVTIMNLKWNTEIATTGADIKAPEGMYFFEDGLMKSKLHFSRECVELLGIGDDTKFFGWVVTNRTELSSLWCSGSTAKVLAYGSIKAKVVDNKLQLDVTQISFDGKKIEVTQENGGYKMKFPTSWGSAVNFVPVITPYKFIGHIYIYDIGEDYMIIKYSGKSSENKDWDDASFRFTIQSTKTFPNYNA